jgi:hypothetical protein
MSFFGHTHSNEFRVVESFTSDNTVGALHICGDLTTWIKRNPSFCVYEIDIETLLPVQRYDYYFDMNKANTNGKIAWEL